MSNRAFIAAAVLVASVGCSQGNLGLEAEGRYHARSTFETGRGIPEREAPELSKFIALGTQPDRVEEWLLDRLGERLGEPYQSLLNGLRDGYDVDNELRTYLSLVAPGYRDTLVRLAREMGDVTSTINLRSELVLEADGFGRTGIVSHEITGVWFELVPETVYVDFGEMGSVDPIVAASDFEVGDKVGSGERMIYFGDQRVRLPYGRVLSYVMNEVLVERRDPFADSLSELLGTTVPCNDIGDLLTTLLEAGTPELYGTACAAAFGELGDAVLPDRLGTMTTSLTFEGEAVMVDSLDQNDLGDGLKNGQWEGTLGYPSTAVTLRRPGQVFSADRSTARRDNEDETR
ncbi:MAG: hypothetical protein KJO07_14360 [Deltaproteobacteria bacterium]|nr:hypothetical protein [Deltaproteobacteria bacterium]